MKSAKRDQQSQPRPCNTMPSTRRENEGERVTYRVVVEGLKLPTMNRVLRWLWKQRKAEVDRVRKLVVDAAMYGHGLTNPTPLSKASVVIRAHGPYSRTDGDAVYAKDLIDSIVARPLIAYGRNVGRRWGLVLNDDRKTVGKVDFDDVPAETYKVTIEVSAC